jgi:hypothetical protein
MTVSRTPAPIRQTTTTRGKVIVSMPAHTEKTRTSVGFIAFICELRGTKAGRGGFSTGLYD